MFLFNGKLYTHCDGEAMSATLGPLLVNFLMCSFERDMLDECSSDFKSLVYERYVEDTLSVFRDTSHVTRLLDYLSTRHANIYFTHEQECNNKLVVP